MGPVRGRGGDGGSVPCAGHVGAAVDRDGALRGAAVGGRAGRGIGRQSAAGIPASTSAAGGPAGGGGHRERVYRLLDEHVRHIVGDAARHVAEHGRRSAGSTTG